MTITAENKDGTPDDACDSCNEPIPPQAALFCKQCVEGDQDDDENEDGDDDLEAEPKSGRRCDGCGERTSPPVFCQGCAEQSADAAASVSAEWAKYSANRPQRSDAATNALETRVALRQIDAQKEATARMFGPRLPTAKRLRAPSNEAELIVARAAAGMRGEQFKEPKAASRPSVKKAAGALEALLQWDRMSAAQRIAEARKQMKALCTGIAGEDLEASARAFVDARNGSKATRVAATTSASPTATALPPRLTRKQRATLAELQCDAVAAGIDPARVADAYQRANATTSASRPVVKRRAPQDVSGPDLALALAAPRRLGLTERDFYQIEVDSRGEIVSWREFNADGECVGMRDPKTKRAVGAA